MMRVARPTEIYQTNADDTRGHRMVKDIREVPREEYWQELRERWGALLSYRYIGKQFSGMNTVEDAPVRLRHDMRNPSGGIMLSPIAITCPGGGGGKTDLEAVPNPVIHSIQILDPGRDVRRIDVLDSQSLKDGQRMGFGRAKIVDADNPSRVLALVDGQSVSIGDVPPGLQRFDDGPIMEIEDSPDLPPLWQVFGATRRPDRHWALPELHAEIASPDAALHIGPQHVVLETAAFDLAAGLAGTDALQAEGSHVMFLARGKSGPFRVDGETFAGSNGKVGVQVVLRDEGAQDRAVTSASYVFGSAGVAS
jgi:hypothetical protein